MPVPRQGLVYGWVTKWTTQDPDFQESTEEVQLGAGMTQSLPACHAQDSEGAQAPGSPDGVCRR